MTCPTTSLLNGTSLLSFSKEILGYTTLTRICLVIHSFIGIALDLPISLKSEPTFIKRSGQGGGIVARGSIAELPKPIGHLERPEFLGADLWIDQPDNESLKVGIQLDEVRLTDEEGMVSTQILEGLTELAGHPLVTVRQGGLG